MKKLVPVIALIMVPVFAMAVSQQSQTTNNGNSTQVQASTQSQTRTQTNNPGVGTMTTAEVESRVQEELKTSAPTYSPRNSVAQVRMSSVATAVENILRVAERNTDQTVGEQIRVVARAQSQSTDKVNKALDKAETRTDFAKFFLGANFDQLKEAKQEMEQNRLRIKELQRLMLQVTNEGDKTELQNQIDVLENQNTALANQLDLEDNGFSLFGWFFRWFYKY